MTIDPSPISPTQTPSPVENGPLTLAEPIHYGGMWRRILRRLARNRGAMAGALIVVLMILIALAAPYASPYDPDKLVSRKFEPPSREFWLGTDNLGRDLASRLMYGSRASIGAAAAATVVISIIGITVGAFAGYLGGWADGVAMRVVDVLLAFPSLILALAIVGILGPGLYQMLIAVTIIAWAGYARLVRGVVLQLREQPFIQASVALGAGKPFVVWQHIIPNIISPRKPLSAKRDALRNRECGNRPGPFMRITWSRIPAEHGSRALKRRSML